MVPPPLSQCHHQAEVSHRFRIEIFFRNNQGHNAPRQSLRACVFLYLELTRPRGSKQFVGQQKCHRHDPRDPKALGFSP